MDHAGTHPRSDEPRSSRPGRRRRGRTRRRHGRPAALKAALDGAYGVFSVQPASGAPGTPPDHSWQDEVAAGRNVADAAASAGVRHLVYSSANSAQLRSGIRILENKWAIEEHIRKLGISGTGPTRRTGLGAGR
ncbi:hypothetical protein DKG71_21490 [Streptomyces sp. NEAU-S7GS2]|nr:hypothetical protein DKG71_21490 [Streptomyces sp. NEAU-S7GS2]